MGYRVEETDVRCIIDTVIEVEDLTPFIAAANVIVTDRVAGRTYLGPDGTQVTVTDATLVEIEKWLAAHFAAMRDKRVAADAIGPGSFTYEGKTDMHLNFTRYGQQAQMLDPTGSLQAISASDDAPTFMFKATGA